MSGTKNGNGDAGRPAIGPAEALAMLQSAAGYCLAAGLSLRAGNLPGLGLVLSLDAGRLEGGRFVLAEPEPAQAAPAAQAQPEPAAV